MAKARYSAFALECDIVGCFLEAQLKQFESRKIQNPEVIRQVKGQPTQFASQKALRMSEVCDKYLKPWVRVPLM